MVSNRGRTQAKHARGDGWFRKEMKKPGTCRHYAEVKVGDQHCQVHILVGELFYEGDYPVGWDRWDHIDTISSNNDIRNLRPVTAQMNAQNRRRVA